MYKLALSLLLLLYTFSSSLPLQLLKKSFLEPYLYLNFYLYITLHLYPLPFTLYSLPLPLPLYLPLLHPIQYRLATPYLTKTSLTSYLTTTIINSKI